MNIRVFSTEAPLRLLNNYLLLLALLNLLIWFGFCVDCFLVTDLGVNVITGFLFLLPILQSKHFCHHVILACPVINALQS